MITVLQSFIYHLLILALGFFSDINSRRNAYTKSVDIHCALRLFFIKVSRINSASAIRRLCSSSVIVIYYLCFQFVFGCICYNFTTVIRETKVFLYIQWLITWPFSLCTRGKYSPSGLHTMISSVVMRNTFVISHLVRAVPFSWPQENGLHTQIHYFGKRA